MFWLFSILGKKNWPTKVLVIFSSQTSCLKNHLSLKAIMVLLHVTCVPISTICSRFAAFSILEIFQIDERSNLDPVSLLIGLKTNKNGNLTAWNHFWGSANILPYINRIGNRKNENRNGTKIQKQIWPFQLVFEFRELLLPCISTLPSVATVWKNSSPDQSQ
jgi:hypothetical protein